MILERNGYRVRVYLERTLDWQVWVFPKVEIVLAGKDSYHQLVWTTVHPHVLETDPGPLDARVP